MEPDDREHDEITFTFADYERLLRRLKRENYSFSGYREADEEHGKTAILRHDVDWSPEKALKMAKLEADLGISSTFFFLLTSPFYNLLYEENRAYMDEVRELGCDVGLHFSTHQYWKAEPPPEKLTQAVNTERRILSLLLEEHVDVVSFHIPPNWILQRRFDEFISTYEPRFFDEFAYRGDSNQRWREEHPFESTIPDRIQILTHPGLWGESGSTFENRLRSEQERRFDSISAFLQHQFIDDAVER